MHIGLELTFIPNLPGPFKEFRRKRDARMVTAALNALLLSDLLTQDFHAKVEPFHRTDFEGHLFDSWCIEVNHRPLDSWEFVYDNNDMRQKFELVYAHAYSLNLHPRLQWKRRDGTIVHAPTAANHIHLGLDLFPASSQSLVQLHYLQRFLCMDFANHPWIRGLFCQWSDDLNTRPLSTWFRIDHIYEAFSSAKSHDMRETVRNLIVDDVLHSSNITQRFTSDSKRIYASWENRFFDMPATYDELRFQVVFLHCWTTYYINGLRSDDTTQFCLDHQDFTLTQASFNEMVVDDLALFADMTAFFDRIGLDYSPVIDVFYCRNLANRIMHDKTKV